MELKRLLAAGAIVGALVVGAAAQSIQPHPKPNPTKEITSFSGEMTLTTGYARRSDGTYVSVAGMKIPYTAHRIQVGPVPKGEGGRGGRYAAGETYKNDTPGTYFWSGPEFPMPSALDDCVMSSAGRGQPWTNMTVGYHAGSPSQILLRWIVFDSFVAGRGAGVSAFDNPLADWGGFFRFQGVGDWKVTFNFTILGLSVSDGNFWLASQIREPLASGEGAFRPDFWPMFSGGGVALGTSEDLFYYDGTPLDGIYDETEVDHFGGPPGLANLLLAIETGGTVSEAFPTSFTTESGAYQLGEFFDLWFVDQSEVIHQESPDAESEYPISVIINGLSPAVPANVTSLRFNLDGRINHAGGLMRVDLFNYQTNQWVVIHLGPAPTLWLPQSWTMGANPSHFVSPSRQMRARIRYQVTAFESSVPIRSFIDRATWVVGRP